MKKLALLLSLLALGALGLAACGGGGDDEAAAASESETARDRTSCGDVRVSGRPFPLVEVAVVEGDVPCRAARRVIEDLYHGRVDDLVASEPYLGEIALVGSWRCGGLDGLKSCKKAVRTPSVKKIRARAPIDEGGQTPDPMEASETETTVGSGGEAASPPPTPAGVGPTEDPHAARQTVTEQGVPFSFRVPVGHFDRGTEGWWERFSSISTDKSAGGPISINKSETGPQGAEAIIFWTSFPAGEYADPCARLLSPPVGSSAADLAAAVSAAPGTELLTGPSNVALGGRPAKHVELTVRERVGCDPGFFYTWKDVFGGALWPKTGVSDTIRVWIVDVHGTRLFIEAETKKWASRDFEQEVQQIVESIKFE